MGAAKDRRIDARKRRQDSLANRGETLKQPNVPEATTLKKIEKLAVVKNPTLTKRKPGRPVAKNLGKGAVKSNVTRGKEKK